MGVVVIIVVVVTSAMEDVVVYSVVVPMLSFVVEVIVDQFIVVDVVGSSVVVVVVVVVVTGSVVGTNDMNSVVTSFGFTHDLSEIKGRSSAHWASDSTVSRSFFKLVAILSQFHGSVPCPIIQRPIPRISPQFLLSRPT